MPSDPGHPQCPQCLLSVSAETFQTPRPRGSELVLLRDAQGHVPTAASLGPGWKDCASVAAGGGDPAGHRSQLRVKRGSLLEETRNSRLSPWGCQLAQGRRKREAVTAVPCRVDQQHPWAPLGRIPAESRMFAGASGWRRRVTDVHCASNPRQAILTLKGVFLTM